MDYNQIFNFMTSKYISLGNDCTIAMILAHLNKKQATLPLDWVVCKDFETCINLIDSRFKYFIDDPEIICEVKDAIKGFLSKGWLEFCKGNFDDNKFVNSYINKKIHITYVHDFKKDIPFDENYLIVKKKYIRRIERFYNILKEKGNLINFIFYYPDLNNESLHKFENILSSINPDLNYKFHIITHNRNINTKFNCYYINKKMDRIYTLNCDKNLISFIKDI